MKVVLIYAFSTVNGCRLAVSMGLWVARDPAFPASAIFSFKKTTSRGRNKLWINHLSIYPASWVHFATCTDFHAMAHNGKYFEFETKLIYSINALRWILFILKDWKLFLSSLTFLCVQLFLLQEKSCKNFGTFRVDSPKWLMLVITCSEDVRT